jgi:hypothetical protein
MHEILKEYNEKLNLMVLRCPEGCRITSWNEGDDILNYSSFSVAYCPVDADTSIYHCISAEEDEKYLAEQLEKILLTK